MNFIGSFVYIILHIDKYLNIIIQNYGLWTYLILFIIVFSETGFVVIPFLPGDSLIFAAGAFSALGSMNIWVVFLLLGAAALLGDAVNFHIGQFIGPKVFEGKDMKILNRENLMKTHRFYEKHGGKTIIFARFIPVIRTFAPFVAGIGKMNYLKFLSYNFIGGISWVALFAFGGYFFGNVPTVKNNFTIVIFAIIIISILPAVIEYLRQKYIVKDK